MDRASLEQLLGQGLSLAEIGRRFDRHEATVSYWVEKHGLEAANRPRYVSRGGIAREELEALVGAGKSIAEIAEAVGRSKATVRHWLIRYGLKTHKGVGDAHRTRRRPPSRRAATVMMHCSRHGETDVLVTAGRLLPLQAMPLGRGGRRRRKVKAILVEEAGGACCLCGYDRYMRALHFHHLDPSQKRHEINAKGVAIALDKLRVEAQKCVLLCSNCHAEVEDGRWSSRTRHWIERTPSGVANTVRGNSIGRVRSC